MNRTIAVLPFLTAATAWSGSALAQGAPCHVPPMLFQFSNPVFNSDGNMAVTAEGDYLYLVAGSLRVYDISDPTSPALAGQLPAAVGHSIEIRGTTAYIGGNRSLRIVDITDPTMPALLGSYSQTPAGSAMAVNPLGVGDDVAVVFGSNRSSIQIVDITNPAAPTAVQNFSVGANINDLAMSGDTAFAATVNGLRVIDLSTPSSPALLTTYLAGTQVSGVAISGDTVYLAVTNAIEAIDVSSPAAPSPVGSIAVWAGDGMEIDGNRLMTTTGIVIDISNPAAMAIEDQFDLIGSSLDAGISGDQAFILTFFNGIYGFQIDERPTPAVASAPMAGFNSDLVRSGDLILAANGGSGLEIIDASTPGAPVVVGSVDTPGNAKGIAVSGSIACVADDNSGLQVIDFSEPMNPSIVGSLPVVDLQGNPSQAEDVTIIGTNAFVAVSGNAGVNDPSTSIIVVDISTPSSPTLINTINTGVVSRSHRRIDSEGNVLAVLTEHYNSSTGSFPQHSSTLIDVTNPMSPFVGAPSPSQSGRNASDIRIRDGYVWTTNSGSLGSSSSLRTFIFSPALTLQQVDQQSYGGTIFSGDPVLSHGRIAIGDGAMYVVCDGGSTYRAIAEYDLTDPAAPRLVGIYRVGTNIRGIDASGPQVTFGDATSVGLIDFAACSVCAADVNGDGMLSPADFTAWIAAFNAAATECDQNGDGLCTPADFTAWIANYNAGC